MVFGLVKAELQVLLSFWNDFEIIRDLEPLHVLNDASEFVIFIEIK